MWHPELQQQLSFNESGTRGSWPLRRRAAWSEAQGEGRVARQHASAAEAAKIQLSLQVFAATRTPARAPCPALWPETHGGSARASLQRAAGRARAMQAYDASLAWTNHGRRRLNGALVP